MAGYRSENNKFSNKLNFKDLNMTQYPNEMDTRDNNINMKGHVNIGEGKVPDYVMAEFVNTLYDGVMSIQRTLGRIPMVPIDTKAEDKISVIEKFTVKDRLDRIENGLFDERYGGKGWIYNASRPTLNNHHHTGINGQPPKIDLVAEVVGKLAKQNINLTQTASGLTGADIKINASSAENINDSVNDKLSKSKGGTIVAPVYMKDTLHTRTHIELISSQMPQNAKNVLVSDTTSTNNQSLKCTGAGDILKVDISNMLYGKYVCSIRVKTTVSGATPLIRMRTSTYDDTYNANNFSAVNTWKEFYFVFDITSANRTAGLIIDSPNASSAINLDNIVIEKIHPSVLDR